MKKLSTKVDSIPSAGTNADSDTLPIVGSSSHNSSKPNVIGSARLKELVPSNARFWKSHGGIHNDKLKGLVKIKTKGEIKKGCRIFYELGEKLLTKKEEQWNSWVRGDNPVKVKFIKGKVVEKSLIHYLNVGRYIKKPTGVFEIEPTWVKSGYFKEIIDVNNFLKDTRLNDFDYIEHHNFHIIMAGSADR